MNIYYKSQLTFFKIRILNCAYEILQDKLY